MTLFTVSAASWRLPDDCTLSPCSPGCASPWTWCAAGRNSSAGTVGACPTDCARTAGLAALCASSTHRWTVEEGIDTRGSGTCALAGTCRSCCARTAAQAAASGRWCVVTWAGPDSGWTAYSSSTATGAGLCWMDGYTWQWQGQGAAVPIDRCTDSFYTFLVGCAGSAIYSACCTDIWLGSDAQKIPNFVDCEGMISCKRVDDKFWCNCDVYGYCTS